MIYEFMKFDTPDNLQEWGGVARQHQLENGSLYDYLDWGDPVPFGKGSRLLQPSVLVLVKGGTIFSIFPFTFSRKL